MATDAIQDAEEGEDVPEFTLYSAPPVTRDRTTYRAHVVPIDRCVGAADRRNAERLERWATDAGPGLVRPTCSGRCSSCVGTATSCAQLASPLRSAWSPSTGTSCFISAARSQARNDPAAPACRDAAVGCDDGSILGAGDKLLTLLERWDVRNVLLVCGIQARGAAEAGGMRRYQLVLNTAKDALQLCYAHAVAPEAESAYGDADEAGPAQSLTAVPARQAPEPEPAGHGRRAQRLPMAVRPRQGVVVGTRGWEGPRLLTRTRSLPPRRRPPADCIAGQSHCVCPRGAAPRWEATAARCGPCKGRACTRARAGSSTWDPPHLPKGQGAQRRRTASAAPAPGRGGGGLARDRQGRACSAARVRAAAASALHDGAAAGAFGPSRAGLTPAVGFWGRGEG